MDGELQEQTIISLEKVLYNASLELALKLLGILGYWRSLYFEKIKGKDMFKQVMKKIGVCFSAHSTNL